MQGLELAVPGTYIAGEPVVTIAAFAPQLHVITSKQRPRKLTIHGSDGAEYVFLLKVRLLLLHWHCLGLLQGTAAPVMMPDGIDIYILLWLWPLGCCGCCEAFETYMCSARCMVYLSALSFWVQRLLS